nr:MAG TPA: hypothetical protein [Caudoviricetes sp.]
MILQGFRSFCLMPKAGILLLIYFYIKSCQMPLK